MTKAKSYYEAYLVLQCLSEVEYNLIPKDLLYEITSRMEKDDSIKIDPSIPLEKQKLSEKTYDILDRVINAIEKAYGKDAIDHPEDVVVEKKDDTRRNKVTVEEIDLDYDAPQKPSYDYSRDVPDSKLKEENIRLKNIIESLKQENAKVGMAKDLVIDYKNLVKKQELEISKLKEQVTKLQGDNADLNEQIQKFPKIIRRIFIKDDVKLLKWCIRKGFSW